MDPLHPLKKLSYKILCGKNRKERPNRLNNGDLIDKAKLDVVRL